MLISAGGLLPSNHTRSFSTTNTQAAASNVYLTHESAMNSSSSNDAEAATLATLVDEAVASRTLVSLALTRAAAEVTSLPTVPTGAHATHTTFRSR